ncbi:hypothetical protein BDF22DRAFT_652678 [Syncephalis plumigaleata]|nr:hypothetical protein BDF22DRAFT_652678 [Syncephalis plumigaleata]
MTATNLSNSQVIRLKEEFSVLDADNRGTINFDSLLALYYELDVATDKDELEQLVGSKAVEANLFDIDAALQTYGKLNELLFDRDHDGKVTAEELQMIMTHVTKEQYTTDEAAELVTILDTDKNGFIDVDELLGLIKSRGEVAAS